MTLRAWQSILTGVALCVTTGLLTGCPKAVPPAPDAGAAPGTSGGAGVGASGQTAGVPAGSTSGAGAGGTGATGGPGTGGSEAAAGTGGRTLPNLPSPQEFVNGAGLSDIHFDFDKYAIRAQDRTTLDVNAQWLTRNAGALILIEGHTDERGTSEYNLALGERRAQITRDQLVARGIASSRITTVTYGKERPACTDRSETCWVQNRRAHFLVKA